MFFKLHDHRTLLIYVRLTRLNRMRTCTPLMSSQRRRNSNLSTEHGKRWQSAGSSSASHLPSAEAGQAALQALAANSSSSAVRSQPGSLSRLWRLLQACCAGSAAVWLKLGMRRQRWQQHARNGKPQVSTAGDGMQLGPCIERRDICSLAAQLYYVLRQLLLLLPPALLLVQLALPQPAALASSGAPSLLQAHLLLPSAAAARRQQQPQGHSRAGRSSSIDGDMMQLIQRLQPALQTRNSASGTHRMQQQQTCLMLQWMLLQLVQAAAAPLSGLRCWLLHTRSCLSGRELLLLLCLAAGLA